jgi:hypothetical protein
MKNHSVLTLDRRYTGSHHFKYRIRVNGGPDYPQSVDNFRTMMDWCSQTWNSSVDVDHHRILMFNNYKINDLWAWQLRQPGMRRQGIDFHLFLKSDTELALFELKFS